MDLYHKFVSGVTDDAVSGEVGPDEWNAVHVPSLDPSVEAIYEDDFVGGTDDIARAFGERGWAEFGTGTSSTATATAGHPGVMDFTTSTTINTGIGLCAGNGDTSLTLLATDCSGFCFVIKTGSAITTMDLYFGLFANCTPANIASNAAIALKYIAADSAKWQAWTRDSGGTSAETASSGADVATSTWYLLEARRSGDDWEFYVNESLIATHTLADDGVPTTGLQPALQIIARASAAARTMTVDYAAFKILTGTRY
jgi:hypothetical protein